MKNWAINLGVNQRPKILVQPLLSINKKREIKRELIPTPSCLSRPSSSTPFLQSLSSLSLPRPKDNPLLLFCLFLQLTLAPLSSPIAPSPPSTLMCPRNTESPPFHSQHNITFTIHFRHSINAEIDDGVSINQASNDLLGEI